MTKIDPINYTHGRVGALRDAVQLILKHLDRDTKSRIVAEMSELLENSPSERGDAAVLGAAQGSKDTLRHLLDETSPL